MFRLLLPRSLGGDELHLKTLAQVTETIASADASTAWCMGQGAGCAMSAAYLKPEVARRLFGPADAVLAWGAGIQGKAVAVDGGYRVTGKWMFASGCANATLLGGHSYVFEKDGTPRKRADGSPADRTVLLVKSKAQIEDMWHTLGLRGTASYTYQVTDLFVPEEETIDRDRPEGAGRDGYALPVPHDAGLCGGLQRTDARHRPGPDDGAQGARHEEDAAGGGVLAQGERGVPVPAGGAGGEAAREPRLPAHDAR